MTSLEPRAALTALIAALERHLDVAVASDGEDDLRIDAAEEQIVAALENYDDALFDAYGIATPFGVFDDEEDDEEDEDFDDDDISDDFDDFDLLDDEDDDEDDEDDLDEDFDDDFDDEDDEI